MDEQHKKIISLINYLSECPCLSVDSPEIFKVLEQLGKYAEIHLADEEALMEAIGFPDQQAHKKIHQDYIDHYKMLSDAVAQKVDNAPKEMLGFLVQWWMNHIQKEDMKYRPYCTGAD